MKKILIGIPSGGSSQDTFNICLRNLENYMHQRQYIVETIYQISPYIDWNREALAECAVERGYDYLFFLDNDMVFNSNILEELLKHDVDVVTTNYITKEEYQTPRFMCIDRENNNVPTTAEKEGLEQVYLAPTGTMLIKTSVFPKLEKMWFDTIRDNGIGEDFFFCLRCDDAGIPVYCDHTLSKQVGHRGAWTYTWQDAYRPERENIFQNIKQSRGFKVIV